MTPSVRPALQVIEFARRLAPEPRRALKLALKGLAHGRGDFRALDGSLSGYFRLRVGRHRVVFNYLDAGTLEAVFAEDRNLVYDVFEAEFKQEFNGEASTEANLLPGAKIKVHGEVIPQKK